METFDRIYQRAAERKGGSKRLESLLPQPATDETLSQLADSVYLSAMSMKIFQSGFVWKVVENKWPGFEQVMWGFEPKKLSLASDEQIEKMAQDTRIIRNLTKVKSVRDNAYYLTRVAKQYGSFGQFIAQWPSDKIVELWLELKKSGSRLGGNTGPYFLRSVGKDTFLLSRDVVAYLVGQNIIDKNPSSQSALRACQNAFNHWQQQSGRPLCHISRVISCSIGDNIS